MALTGGFVCPGAPLAFNAFGVKLHQVCNYEIMIEYPRHPRRTQQAIDSTEYPAIQIGGTQGFLGSPKAYR